MLSNIQPLVDVCRHYRMQNLFDIGSRDGDDAEYLRTNLNIDTVHVFEPNPVLSKVIKKKFPHFNVHELAISNYEGSGKFYCVKDNFSIEHRGVSSLKNRVDDFYNNKVNIINVKVNKFSTFIKQNNINEIDLVKLDVEGCTYEALESFEENLEKVKFLHIEAEHKIYWEGQKLYDDVSKLLEVNFQRVFFYNYAGTQSDSIWINRKL